MVGLVDCNNFFVSCERTLRPELIGKAVVVLSNNDGCVVARSNEAKALGVKMGQPAFELRDIIRTGRLIALSGNHLLYHDISVAVHEIFRSFAPATIDYSVDEAFLDMSGIPTRALTEIGEGIYQACMQQEGIPVTVGFAPSKTLAKIASHIGKKSGQHVCILTEPAQIQAVCADMPIGELWGVGRRLAKRMYVDGIHTIGDFASRPVTQIRSAYGVNGERTWLELHGKECITLDAKQRQWQDSISETRTFPEDIGDFNFLQSRISLFASHCAASMRKIKAGCQHISVFLRTNRFRTDIPPQCPAIQIDMPTPISSTSIIVSTAIEGLKQIYDPAFKYKRAGVLLTGLTSIEYRQQSLFDDDILQDEDCRQQPLMDTIDKLNSRLASPLIRQASQMGIGRPPRHDGISTSFSYK